jgi:type I restriction enzyme R subunit
MKRGKRAEYKVNRDKFAGNGEFHDDDENKVRKFYVNGVDVKVLAKRVQYYDADGKLVTESFQDYTRKTMLKDSDYASLDSFVRKWQEAPANRSSLKSWSNSVSVGCAGRRGGKRSRSV